MVELMCQICLLNFDNGERQMQAEEDEAPHPCQTLWHKLQSIGFLQVKGESEDPLLLCSWCSARVEDAYELKQQCIEASQALRQNERHLQNVKDYGKTDPFLEGLRNLEINAAQSLTRPDIPQLLKITPRSSLAGSTISVMMAGAHDMFTCVRNLSSTLRLTSSLLSSAVHFTENTLSLLTVLTSLKEESLAMKKSVETIRKEAKLWKIKSAIMDDATSFVRDASFANLLWSKMPSSFPKETQKVPEALQENVTLVPACSTAVSNVSSVISVRHLSLEDKLSPDSSSTVCLPSKETDSIGNLDDVELGDNIGLLSSESPSLESTSESQSVRRSIRSRSMVDHLVYWPSFKKQGSINIKPSAAKLKPSIQSSSTPMTSTQALDCLLLRRDVDSESENANKEKWAIVKKRKVCHHLKSGKKKSVCAEAPCSSDPSSNFSQTKSASQVKREEAEEDEKIKNEDEVHGDKDVENDVDTANSEDEEVQELSSDGRVNTCNICGKTLSCTRNLRAHIKMHTGSSPYQCNYCHKVFSSGWNRAQHERVHTGEKPYVCDICQMPFRYNVSLRHHKLKTHKVPVF